MRLLRTISTSRLLATLAGLVVVIAAGSAIAVAATSSTAKPRPESLATSLHRALTAAPISGVSAHISFTNNLISTADFTGDHKDPILQGASGRLWVSDAGQVRLELQSDNGDAQIVVNGNRFSISEPSANTVYEGTLPPQKPDATKTTHHGIPTVAQLQSDITRLMGHLSLSGSHSSDPTDVGGRPAYSVTISPKHSAGLLGSAQIAWDAATGVPLNVAVYARGNATPVLALTVDDIAYGKVNPSVFDLTPPAGDKVVTVATPGSSGETAKSKRRAKAADVSGVSAVASHLPFTLAAPASIEGLPRQTVKLLSWGGKPAALVTYGQNLGGVAVIEQSPDPSSAGSAGSTGSGSTGSGSGSGAAMGNLSLPTVTITGTDHQTLASGQELGTALGTVLRFTHGGVAYTVLGSVTPYVAEHAAAALLSAQ